MVTRKDLVEAQDFDRRRLVAALVAGAPGGREVEPARPGRAVAAGLALGALVLVGAVVAGMVSPAPTTDGDRRGSVTERGSGADDLVPEPAPSPTSTPCR